MNMQERNKAVKESFSLCDGLVFDLTLVDDFNRFVALSFGLPPCKIVVEKFRGIWMTGQHCYSKKLIRINEKLDDRGRWGTLIHEMAHYRVRNHRPQFHNEMMLVYKKFNQWLILKTEPLEKGA